MKAMGTLFIVATPIGNLKDITFRALEILSEVDFIACEDTRKTRLLINHYFKGREKQITEKLFSYYEKVENQKMQQVLNMLINDKDVALVSDSGTPTISDPGFKLVRECLKQKINVISIPGPSSVISTLAMSGLPTDKFTFLGFLPKKQGNRLTLLRNVKKSQEFVLSSVILFESPHKIIQSLIDLKSVFEDIEIVIVREHTKIYEEVIRMRITEILTDFETKPPKGEFTILFSLK